MNNEKTEELAELIADFCTAIEAACVNLKQQIAKIYTEQKEQTPQEQQKYTWNPEAIAWANANGSAGPYERSEDVNNAEFKAMLADLQAHNGKLTRDGKFYWIFRDGVTVGRKDQKWSKKQ